MDSDHFSHAVHSIPLIDHHVHSVLPQNLERADFEVHLSESALAAPAGTSHLDSQAGFAVRRHCAPVLDLLAHSSADDYLARRAELGWHETTGRLLKASGVAASLIDTGHAGSSLLSNTEFAELAGQEVHEIVRLESVAERLLDSGLTAASFPSVYREAITNAIATGAIGFKSVIAYRAGFDFDPARPTDSETIAAVAEHLRSQGSTPSRVSHPTLLRFLLWTGADTGLPLQLHVGYGDSDLDLARCNPALLMPWLRLLPHDASPIMLLHCYPYHREAGYLAQVFPNVYFDLGLAINYTGAASTAVIRAGLELAPFAKLLYSSDAWGLPELHLLGAQLWRDGLSRALWEFVERGEWSASEALRVAGMVSSENARRVYTL